MKHRPLLLAALAGTLVASCRDTTLPATPKSGPEPVNVSIVPAESTRWDRTVTIVGTLFPKDEATVGSEIEGTVLKTNVDFGDRVTQGQLLAMIDAATYQADLKREQGNVARVEANLTNARKVLDRDQGLQKSGAVAASDLDTALAQVAQWEAEASAARAAVGMSELNIRRCQIKAPFDGAIAKRVITQGDFVKIGSPLFTVVNDKVLKFIFEVPEKHASQVTKGLSIEFNVDNYPGEKFTGSVYLISPVVTTATRAFSAGALVQNPDLRLKASTFARGRLVLEKNVPALVVPQEAVITFAGVTKVYVAEKGAARSRVVKAGRVQNGKQEILDGLKPGEAVITSGLGRLIEGSPVNPQTPPKSK